MFRRTRDSKNTGGVKKERVPLSSVGRCEPRSTGRRSSPIEPPASAADTFFRLSLRFRLRVKSPLPHHRIICCPSPNLLCSLSFFTHAIPRILPDQKPHHGPVKQDARRRPNGWYGWSTRCMYFSIRSSARGWQYSYFEGRRPFVATCSLISAHVYPLTITGHQSYR